MVSSRCLRVLTSSVSGSWGLGHAPLPFSRLLLRGVARGRGQDAGRFGEKIGLELGQSQVTDQIELTGAFYALATSTQSR